MSGLSGRRVVVVGASSGIGRAFAQVAITSGAQVLAVARRTDALAELCDGSSAEAFSLDVAAATAQQELDGALARVAGPIDLVLCSVGAAPLRPVSAITAEDWHAVLETNLVGVHRVLTACIPHMAAGGIIAAISSESVDEGRAGLGAYSASKAGLEQLLKTCRTEHPGVRFATIVVGATVPTEFSAGFEPEVLQATVGQWADRGQLPSAMMQTSEVAGSIAAVLGGVLEHTSVGVEHLVLRSPAPPMSATALAAAFAG